MEDNRKEEQEKRAEIRAILSFRDRSLYHMEESYVDDIPIDEIFKKPSLDHGKREPGTGTSKYWILSWF